MGKIVNIQVRPLDVQGLGVEVLNLLCLHSNTVHQYLDTGRQLPDGPSRTERDFPTHPIGSVRDFSNSHNLDSVVFADDNFNRRFEKEKKQWLLEEMFENRFPRAGGREEG